MLRRPVGLSREKAAVYCAWSFGTALIRFGRRGLDIVAHLLTKHPRLPAKRISVELRHALAVVVRHFEVNDRIHLGHDCPPCLPPSTRSGAETSGQFPTFRRRGRPALMVGRCNVRFGSEADLIARAV